MNTFSLNKNWIFHDNYSGRNFTVDIPGLNVQYLVDNGIIKDPCFAENEKEYSVLANFGFTMSKVFTLSEEELKRNYIELCFQRLDTLCEVYLNGKLIAFTKNIHRKYTFDVKNLLKAEENLLEIKFLSLKKYIKEKQKELHLPYNAMGTTGHPHIRKCACHFGWDFAAELCAQGIGGDCFLTLRDTAVLDFLSIKSSLKEDTGIITAEGIFTQGEISGELNAVLTCPSGKKITEKRNNAGNSSFEFEIENPEIWWSNGLGAQPLYTLTLTHKNSDGTEKTLEKKVAFRNIALDKSKDKYGTNFQFSVNGVPIFAKGGNYIPMDTLYTNITRKKLYTLLKMCKDAGMNMLRVWGGGFYESDDFYDICDELGILLWQDCGFACCAYPFMQEDFLKEVTAEIEENVKRLRHHACLALWCGNNEIESISMAWILKRDFITSTGKFFYDILPKIIEENDGITPYHPTSPSSGKYMVQMNSDSKGDTHIWNTWHGYRYQSFFDTNYSRFCSEFGMQSYPHKGITPHQKCDLGEERLRFYLTKHLALHGKEDYKIYFTQLIQSEYMKYAVEHFRRNSHRCHGSLYWQLNDCHHSASWAAIDFGLNKKALMYHSKHFYENVHPSAIIKDKKAEIFLSCDLKEGFSGILNIELTDTLSGKTDILKEKITLPPMNSAKVSELSLKDIDKKRTVLILKVYDEKENAVSENRVLLCENKDLLLPKPEVNYTIKTEGNMAEITFKAESYIRYLFFSIEGERNAFSDNFFDLSKGEEKTLIAEVESTEDLEKRLSLISLNGALDGADYCKDMGTHLAELFRPMALANIISRFFEQ